MDLSQVKLTKKEWASVEVPVSDGEKTILKLIQDGYHQPQLRFSRHASMATVLKITATPEMEDELYTKYFERDLTAVLAAHGIAPPSLRSHKPKPLKKADQMRLAHMETQLNKQREIMFEFQQIAIAKQTQSDLVATYSLLQTQRATVPGVNTHVKRAIDLLVTHLVERASPREWFEHAYRMIETNPHVLSYEDYALFDHQKDLFRLFPAGGSEVAPPSPKLVMYMAPTGTGKTVTPLGLAGGYRIIYICAARHVGLALAKSAISMEKCVAFAFGCETASDIRLHYYAAAEFTKNHKTGGIFKVDNSDGRKVEIMICDVSSYVIAMHYMMAFNLAEEMIMYWDEPTIGLDVPDHPLHPVIRTLWAENKVANIVLSCATLPKEELLADMMDGYRERFATDTATPTVHTVASYDCRKSITLLDPAGKPQVPHVLFEDVEALLQCVAHCRDNPALLRYVSLPEIVRFVTYAHDRALVEDTYRVETYFANVRDMTMMRIKEYYLIVLEQVGRRGTWSQVYSDVVTDVPSYFRDLCVAEDKGKRLTKAQSLTNEHVVVPPGAPLRRTQSVATVNAENPGTGGILLTTLDAHTLTDGPTIFLAEDVLKIGKFYVQQAKIPSRVMDGILDKLGINQTIQRKMDGLLKALDDVLGKEADKDKKMEKEAFTKPEARKLLTAIEALRGEMQPMVMDAVYVPNTRQHQQVWLPAGQVVERVCVPWVDETAVRDIMELNVEATMKLLLLLGIGVFMKGNHAADTAYTEIMKRLAQEQHLYLIIASSDYIYGTNYQFCHAFLGKDLQNMTQQKIIQAMGRVGRGQVQQSYTIRFRDTQLLKRLFLPCDDNVEAKNMAALLG